MAAAAVEAVVAAAMVDAAPSFNPLSLHNVLLATVQISEFSGMLIYCDFLI